jgi:1,4-dihydroxy-2-naphthoate octaprenyltransferase
MRSPSGVSHYLRIFKPVFLLAGVLLYALGGGIARYLGHPINWVVYALGQGCVTLLQLVLIFLKEYFDSLPSISLVGPRSPAELEHLTHQQALLAAAASLAGVSALVILMMRRGELNAIGGTALGIAFLLAFFYSAPPFRLAYNGYGELTASVLMCNLFPALAFLLQAGELHRLLAMATFPLSFLYVTLGLVQSLPGYASDLKNDRLTLMVRMGWKQGMNLHNIMVLVGFLLLGAAIMLGLPWPIGGPALLALPVGLYQIWMMYQISSGAAPRWNLLQAAAAATFGLAAYFLVFGFWTV